MIPGLRRLRPARILALAPLFLVTACAAVAPQDALKPEGPIARQQDNLFKPVFWIAVVVFVVVEALIVIAAFKFRDRGGKREPKQVHGNTRLEIAWTIAPALLLAGIAVPTVATIIDQAQPVGPTALTVKVIGHQWWWEYRYQTGDEQAPEVVTANELVIPVGREVALKLTSADVIHSFWVPKLAGKQDAVPERINDLVLLADRPGEWQGQCAEFCAISHANMRLKVIAMPETEFDRWLEDQKRPGVTTLTGDAAAGRDLFVSNACVNCHAVEGLEGASGTLGPNLTHFGSRDTFASVIFRNTESNLIQWVKNARRMKPGAIMPAFDRPLPPGEADNHPNFKVLTDEQVRQIVAFLRSLL